MRLFFFYVPDSAGELKIPEHVRLALTEARQTIIDLRQHVKVRVCVRVRERERERESVYQSNSVCVHACVCMCVCMCVWERERERERESRYTNQTAKKNLQGTQHNHAEWCSFPYHRFWRIQNFTRHWKFPCHISIQSTEANLTIEQESRQEAEDKAASQRRQIQVSQVNRSIDVSDVFEGILPFY